MQRALLNVLTSCVARVRCVRPRRFGEDCRLVSAERVQQNYLRQILRRPRRGGCRLGEKIHQPPRLRPMTAMESKALRPKLAGLGTSRTSASWSTGESSNSSAAALARRPSPWSIWYPGLSASHVALEANRCTDVALSTTCSVQRASSVVLSYLERRTRHTVSGNSMAEIDPERPVAMWKAAHSLLSPNDP